MSDGRLSFALRIVETADPDQRGKVVGLSESGLSLGRSLDNDVAVEDERMSRQHARIEIQESGELVLRDCGSSNGTIFGGKKITSVPLGLGDRFTLGGSVFELVRPAGEPSREVARPINRTVLIRDFQEVARQIEDPSSLKDLGDEETPTKPFLVRDPDAMWVVESGKVDIFTISVDGERPVGRRKSFASVERGEAFFGLDTDERFDSGFLAVCGSGTKLRRFSTHRLSLYVRIPSHKKTLTPLLIGWVTKMSRRLTRGLKRPDATVVLGAGQTVKVPPQGLVVPRGSEVLWIELPAARFLFDGMTGLSAAAEGVLLPLAPGSWLELLTSDEPVELQPKTTIDSIDDHRLWAGLAVFHRLLMECEFLNKGLAQYEEAYRLDRKKEEASLAEKDALLAIQGVLGGTGVWQRPFSRRTGVGPIFEASRLVAEATGITAKIPEEELQELSFEDALRSVASRSGFRTRQVALADEWWRHDQGAMLGQRSEDEVPVALLPTRSGDYELVNAESGVRTAVDSEVAENLAPFAHSFYRPFPDGALSALDLIRHSVWGLKREFTTVGFVGISVGLLSTMTPAITGRVFDSAIPQAERGLLLQLAGALFLVALATAAFKITQNVAMVRVQSRMDYSAQAAIWDRLLNLPTTFFREFSAGDLADRAAGIDRIRGIVSGAGVAAILGSFASIFNAVQMCFYSFSLAGVAVGLTLLYVGMTTLCNYIRLRLERRELRERGQITGLALQLITGVAKLRVANSESHAFKVWATAFAALRTTAFRAGRVENFIPILNGTFPIISSMAIFVTMVKLQENALAKGEVFDITTGDFLAFSAAFGIFRAAVQALGDASVNLLGIIPVYERLKPIITSEAEVDESKIAPPKLSGEIELSNVQFKYSEDSPWILSDLSLQIKAGQFVAFVGSSGSGKSTLMKVMLGFEKPNKGAVYYDGQDLATLDVRLVREQLGVVLQENRLFPADIYRNIIGSKKHTVREAWKAAAAAGLEEDIKRMPMQMHTYVSEGGGGFSGGQKQRLMIARALVNQPRVLYLDEATSALDNRTQKIVKDSMDQLDATRIVIAHRLSTIKNADLICFLHKGRIEEQGTYEELMEKGGLFAEMAERQLLESATP